MEENCKEKSCYFIIYINVIYIVYPEQEKKIWHKTTQTGCFKKNRA